MDPYVTKDVIAARHSRPEGTRKFFVGYEERQTVGSGIYLRDSDKLIVYFKVEFSNADYLFLGLQITNPS